MTIPMRPSKNPESVITKITVMIADDHALMRDSLRIHLENQPDIEIIGEAINGEEAVELASKLNPDIIIMDIAMPKLNGLDATRIIKKTNPNISILVLTVYEDVEYILKIMEAGASGYLVKNILGDKLIMAIRLVRDGESVFSNEIKNKLLKHALRYPSTPSSIPVVGDRLSVRELEIFQLAAKGMSNKEISQQLNLNLRTVKSHFVNIFSKLNANSRTEAVMIGLRLGLISIDDIS